MPCNPSPGKWKRKIRCLRSSRPAWAARDLALEIITNNCFKKPRDLGFKKIQICLCFHLQCFWFTHTHTTILYKISSGISETFISSVITATTGPQMRQSVPRTRQQY